MVDEQRRTTHIPGRAMREINIPNHSPDYRAPPVRPTRHRHQHDVIDTPERDRDHQEERPSYVQTQTQIDRYERRKSIDEKQAEACRRYYTDAYKAGVVSRASTLSPDRVDGARGDMSESADAAWGRRTKALAALGTELTSIADHVCIHEGAAEAWAISRREHPRAGIAVFRIAATTLAKHFGIIK